MVFLSILVGRLALATAIVLAVPPVAARAQEVVQPLPGTTDADRLGEQMRVLAANPRDVAALILAGELSLKLDDLSGAASLFARAEKIEPSNARLKAGEASVLVRSERPGEALRYFAQAQAMGLDPARFAKDRGFAYDLIGEQERAQRDYRLALRSGADEETTRRYALSLGISGKRDAALEQLDPLLRDTDRGAWRARAFILAMVGDVPGAERIATTMMPPGMAEGLQPFFQRLPSLPATDRAFAVHFGEVHSTPERVADARLVPALQALGPDPYAPVQVATVVPTAETAKDDKRKKKKKTKPGRIELAAAVVPVKAALPPPPAYRGQPIPVYTAPAAAPMSATARANAQQLATLTTAAPVTPPGETTTRPRDREREVRTPTPTPAPAIVMAAPSPVIQAVPAPAPTPKSSPPAVVMAAPSPVVQSLPTPTPTQTPTPTPTPAPMQVAATPPVVPAATPQTTAVAVSEPAPVQVAAVAPSVTVAPTPSEPPLPKALAHTSNDSILARIIAGLSIPASELGVAPMPGAAAVETNVVAEAKAKEERDAAAEKALAQKAAAEQLAAKKKVAADRKALAAKKIVDDKKAADAKAAAEEKKAARTNPARIWVQVSGGANEGDLPKAWAAVKAKAPAAFAGKSGWSTPLRATNRVLAGPFKTSDAAQDFVNDLRKEGVSAFTFTSDAGQAVTKLPAK